MSVLMEALRAAHDDDSDIMSYDTAVNELNAVKEPIREPTARVGIHTDDQYDYVIHLSKENPSLFMPVHHYEHPFGSSEVGEIGTYNGIKLLDYRGTIGNNQAVFDVALLKRATPEPEPLFIL